MDQIDPKQLELAAQALPHVGEATSDFIKKISGGFVGELNLLLAEKVRFRRYETLVRMVKKAEKISLEAGIAPNAVPLKTLFPILENSSIEEDESMIDRWAALLANAADSNPQTEILPSFPHILKELTAKEAAILDRVYHFVKELGPEELSEMGVDGQVARIMVGVKEEEFELLTDNLFRLGLLGGDLTRLTFLNNADAKFQLAEKSKLRMTRLGFAFVSACRPPE